MNQTQIKHLRTIASKLLNDAGQINKLAKTLAAKQDIETAYRLRQVTNDLFQVFSYLDAGKYETNNFRRWA